MTGETNPQVSDIDRPIFIFGCPRSGTSLLSRIIDAHPRIAVPFESHIYHYMYRWQHRYGDLRDSYRAECLIKDLLTMEDIREWDPPASFAATLAALRRPDFNGVFEAMIASWAAAQGKPRWGEKTPQHALQWPLITGAFPGAQVLFIVRDGRDVAMSYKQTFHGPNHMYPIARRWVHYLKMAEEIERKLGAQNYRLVRYEDLIAHPESTVRSICNFIDEEYFPGMLDAPADRITYRTDQRNLENLKRPILASNSGQWKSQMTRRELKIFEGVAGAELEKFKYERGTEPVELSRFQRTWYHYIEHLPVKTVNMLNNRKTGRIMKQMLRIYLKRRWSLWRTADRSNPSVSSNSPPHDSR